MEVCGGGQHLVQGGEDAVAGGGQLGQRIGRLVGGGGLADALGDVGDGGAERGVTGGAGVGVEVLVAVDVVAERPQAGDGAGGQAGLVVLVQAGGGAVVGLVEADDGDEAGALQDAVCLQVAAAGEEFAGVRVTPDV
ncbi:hypothetical protein ACGF7W_05120 [Streptomyces sp. NPDC048219]|uniref:hypothetical protein n=1 Tax=Streptomyces sp. NPDC048219 TaxID=3365517 RepID=UPI00371409E7